MAAAMLVSGPIATSVQCDLSRIGREQHFDNEVDGMDILQRSHRIEYIESVDTRISVDVLSRDCGPDQGLAATGKHGHILASSDVAYHACVSFRQFERHVAGNRCYAEDVEFVR